MIDEPENPEVFIRDGEVWIPDCAALCAKLGAAYLYYDEGELWAAIPGEGDDLVRDLLASKTDSAPKLATVRPIK